MLWDHVCLNTQFSMNEDFVVGILIEPDAFLEAMQGCVTQIGITIFA